MSNVQKPIVFTANQRDEVRDLGNKSGALQAEPGMKQQTFVAQPVAFNGRQDPIKCVAIQHSIIGRKDNAGAQGPGYRDDGKMFTLDSRGAAHAVAYPDPANSLLAKANMSHRGDTDNLVRIGYRVRRLTPVECLRLQGFLDNWLDLPGASDSAKYKAIGNSIAVPCLEFIIGNLILTVEEDLEWEAMLA